MCFLGFEKIENKESKSGIDLQKRDLDLLLYLNEMGWVSAHFLALKFFEGLEKGSGLIIEARFKTARRRLWLLKESGFLRSFQIGKSENFYVTTPKAVLELGIFFPEIPHLKAINHVSFSQNEHIKRIHYSRFALELSGESLGWRSERRLKTADLEMQKKLLMENISLISQTAFT